MAEGGRKLGGQARSRSLRGEHDRSKQSTRLFRELWERPLPYGGHRNDDDDNTRQDRDTGPNITAQVSPVILLIFSL